MSARRPTDAPIAYVIELREERVERSERTLFYCWGTPFGVLRWGSVRTGGIRYAQTARLQSGDTFGILPCGAVDEIEDIGAIDAIETIDFQDNLRL